MWESYRGNIFGENGLDNLENLKNNAKTYKEITDELMAADFNGMFSGVESLQTLPKVDTGNTSNVDWNKLAKIFSDQKDKKSIDGINEVLEEKGYPEFNEILDYFLDAHPEYKL